MQDLLKSKFINKKGNVTTRYKYIIQTLSKDETSYLTSLFPLYDNVYFKLKSLVLTNDYNKCVICDNIIDWGNKTTCSKECYLKLHNNTCEERYGTKNYFNSNDFKEKTKNTNIEKYGVEHPMKSKEVIDKVKATNIEKYGVDNYFKSEQFTSSIKNININKYGVEHHMKSKEVIDKTNITRLNKKIEYIENKCGIKLTIEQIKSIPFDITFVSDEYLNDLIGYILNNKLPSKDVIISEYGYNNTTSNYIMRFFGYENEINTSLKEREVSNFLISNDIKIETTVRDIIYPYELDIYIPEYNIAIEFNGSYWHSEIYKDKNYHQMKTKMCNDKGITLIHIYEYLFDDKKDIYYNIIKSKLGMNERVYARKCILKEVPKSEERDFLNKYHLQGYISSKYCYGLYDGDKLLTLCSFGKSRFNKNYEYELLRNCTKSGITVVGGLSKLIKYFKTQNDIDDVICYSDASISYCKGDKITQPNYVWIKGNIVYKRYNTQKHKLINILDNFDIKYSESENMHKNGYYRVFDAGNYLSIL